MQKNVLRAMKRLLSTTEDDGGEKDGTWNAYRILELGVQEDIDWTSGELLLSIIQAGNDQERRVGCHVVRNSLCCSRCLMSPLTMIMQTSMLILMLVLIPRLSLTAFSVDML